MHDTVPQQCNAPVTEQLATVSSPASSSQAAERLRVQELLRYFQPPSPDVAKDKPRVALDTSLTAFAQLSALKLDCQRSFISLIDHETQYIIAEATRTVSLETGETEGADDAIYLGATSLDIYWGVCPNTISVFTSTNNSLNITAPYVKANRSYYVMNDLSKVPGYENRPYIVGWPHMRYYAEVPIHSPSGLVIGSLCVVDNKPREGLDIKGIAVLREISHAVMDHLDLVMSKVQRKRAERMIHGLGLFVEGSNSLRDWWMDSEKSSRTVDPSRRRLTINERADQEFGVQRSSKVNNRTNMTFIEEEKSQETNWVISDKIEGPRPIPVSRPSTDAPEALSTSPEAESIPTVLPASLSFSEDRLTKSNTDTTTDGSMRKDSPALQSLGTPSASRNSSRRQLEIGSELESMLARAANLIREALSLNGISFFDTPIGASRIYSHGGGLGRANGGDTDESTAASSGRGRHIQPLSKEIYTVNILAASSRLPNEKFCKVLASSTRMGFDGDNPSIPPFDISETMLQHIVEKFPQGGILEYDDKGPVSHSKLEHTWYKNIPKAKDFSVFGDMPQNFSANSDGSDSAEACYLWRVLPGVRSIILFPLWDSSRDRLFAYNIAWTTDRNRVFQREDFAYLASFCNSITSELSRLDTQAADRAKANFISSISHELRSPLHGVLASAELLKALTKDKTSIDIIDTIETCGSTLLDTMENLLTFAKINDITVTQQQRSSTARSPYWEQNLPQPLKGLIEEVDLGLLLEGVMNTNISGHQFRKSLETSLNIRPKSVVVPVTNPQDSVTVICDVDPKLNWIFATQAGAWKRIAMNLLGNSLKYTTVGFIHIRLSQEEQTFTSHESPKRLICLTVEDSGKGISEEYMKHQLFTPFQQEDPLCPGTGLGLSIVHQLVTAIKGTIDVQSEVGQGTKVEVKAILDSIPEIRNSDLTGKPYNQALSQSNARKVGLVALDLYPDIQEIPTGIISKQVKTSLVVKSFLARAIGNTFDLETVTVSTLDSESKDVDILVTTESHFRASQSAASRQRTLPLIVLCSKLTLDYRSISDLDGPVIYLSQPFGPVKLARALESCIPYLGHEWTPKDHTSRPLPMHITKTPDSKDFQQDSTTSPVGPVLSADTGPEGAPQKQGRHQVLLVEDNPINLKLLATYLEKLGYPCSTAADGLQAVETYKIAHGEFEIIFMDIQMPNMNGMVASYEIRKFEQQELLKRTPIVALTGLASANAQEQAVLSGIDLFLTKPVPLKKLKAVLEDLFDSPGMKG